MMFFEGRRARHDARRQSVPEGDLSVFAARRVAATVGSEDGAPRAKLVFCLMDVLLGNAMGDLASHRAHHTMCAYCGSSIPSLSFCARAGPGTPFQCILC